MITVMIIIIPNMMRIIMIIVRMIRMIMITSVVIVETG